MIGTMGGTPVWLAAAVVLAGSVASTNGGGKVKVGSGSPREAPVAPPSGPQFETPTGPSIRGTVKWYNPEKGFGFVQLADGSSDAFLHVSVVERSGHDSVPPGATLEVRTSPGPKGPQVTEIISVDATTAAQEPPRRPRPERPAYPSGDRAAVAPDQGGQDIFVHASALERASIMGLAEGQRVAVDVAQGQKGPEAVGLRLI